MVEAEIFGGNAVGHGDVLKHYSRVLGKTTTKHPPPAVLQKTNKSHFTSSAQNAWWIVLL